MTHQHRLCRLPVREFIEQFDRRPVRRMQPRDDLRTLDREMSGKLRTQRLRQIVHRIKRSRTALIHPSDDLIRAEAGNIIFFERIGKRLFCQTEDVFHVRLMRAIKKPSGPSVSGMI